MSTESQKSISEILENDALLQEGLGRISKVNRPAFDALYGIHDGVRKTSEEVAVSLGLPEATIKIQEARSIIQLGEEMLQRLLDILSEKEVESVEKVENQRQEKNKAWLQSTQTRLRLSSIMNKVSDRLTKEGAVHVWNMVPSRSQLLIYLKTIEDYTYEDLAALLKVKSSSTARKHYLEIINELGGEKGIAALKKWGVIQIPSSVPENNPDSDEAAEAESK